MTLKLHYWEHSWLRKKADEVVEINDEVKAFVKEFLEKFTQPDMFSPGSIPIGLAATQVGSAYRIFAVCPHQMDGKRDSYGPPKLFINPVLSEPSDNLLIADEGCLSFPGLYLPVIRPESITVEWQDIEGKKFKERVSGYYARQIMHENDHLNGVLFIDRVSKSIRKRIKNDLDLIKKQCLKRT
ncbi:MAG: Peptide deformylase [Chlamydiae bacterium]|nr:Peptide deformylase [Chlamydiota bacterium]